MAKAKAKEIKEAPILRIEGGGGGGNSDPYVDPKLLDRIVVKGRACIAYVTFNMDGGKITGYVEHEGDQYPFSVQLGE